MKFGKTIKIFLTDAQRLWVRNSQIIRIPFHLNLNWILWQIAGAYHLPSKNWSFWETAIVFIARLFSEPLAKPGVRGNISSMTSGWTAQTTSRFAAAPVMQAKAVKLYPTGWTVTIAKTRVSRPNLFPGSYRNTLYNDIYCHKRPDNSCHFNKIVYLCVMPCSFRMSESILYSVLWFIHVL
jgi:hypothetical protein